MEPIELSDRPAEGETEGITCARLQVALAFVRQEFRKPDLSVASAAAAQGISTRYLHKLFERAGIRFTEHLNELRLGAAYRALAENNEAPIAVAALDAGFSDIAHFNRLFKKRFGATPRAIRARS